MDKNKVREFLDAVKEATQGARTEGGPHKDECAGPWIVIYFIETECLAITNGACPGWEFCKPERVD